MSLLYLFCTLPIFISNSNLEFIFVINDPEKAPSLKRLQRQVEKTALLYGMKVKKSLTCETKFSFKECIEDLRKKYQGETVVITEIKKEYGPERVGSFTVLNPRFEATFRRQFFENAFNDVVMILLCNETTSSIRYHGDREVCRSWAIRMGKEATAQRSEERDNAVRLLKVRASRKYFWINAICCAVNVTALAITFMLLSKNYFNND